MKLHKTEDIYLDMAKDLETRFDTSNYELKRPLPRWKNKTSWTNERWIRRGNNDRAGRIVTKNI